MSIVTTTIINNIKWLISDSGTKQIEIAKATNIDTATISRINKGHLDIRNMKFEHVMKLNDYAKKVK